MPELPDVEAFRRYVDETSLDQRIARVEVPGPELLEHVSSRELARRLTGGRFVSTRRHGKHLFVRTDGNVWLWMHFGMTGCLRYLVGDEPPPPHTRVMLGFASGDRLAFDCQRKFGRVGMVDDVDEFVARHRLGPDALAIDPATFRARLAPQRRAIKTVLMNQAVIAGIGNVYADEILFRARVHPATPATRLDGKALNRLFRAMRHVLRHAIAYRAEIEHMPGSWLLPHRGKHGRPCPRCRRPLATTTIDGRTTWLCTGCQPPTHGLSRATPRTSDRASRRVSRARGDVP